MVRSIVERHHDAADAFDEQNIASLLDRALAIGDDLIDVDPAVLLPRRKLGRNPGAKAPGRHAVDRLGRERQAERGEEDAGIAGRRLRRVVAFDDRLDGVDLTAHVTQMPDQRGGDERLADVGPGRGDEDCSHGRSASRGL